MPAALVRPKRKPVAGNAQARKRDLAVDAFARALREMDNAKTPAEQAAARDKIKRLIGKKT